MAPSQVFSTPFTCKGSVIYDLAPRPQGTASQLGPVTHTYPVHHHPNHKVFPVSLPTVQGSRKQFTSTFTGDSGTRQDPLLPSPCGEALLMVDHLKMLLVRLSVGGLSHMQVYPCPHPKLVHLLLFRVHGSSLHLPS